MIVLKFLMWLGLAVAAVLALSAVYSRWATAKVERDHPARGKHTAVKGGAIHWTERGTGAPLVLIHGLSGNMHNFAAMVPLLEDRFRVISIDRPGCGYSSRDSEASAALPEQARMIAEFLTAEGIERPTIVGHSLGGALALALALDHADQIGALALLAPVTQPVPEPPDVFKPLDIASYGLRKLVGSTLAVPLGQLQTRKILEATFKPEPVPDAFQERFDGGGLSLRTSGFIAASGDLTGATGSVNSLVPRLGSITTAGGILYGDSDAILDPEIHGQGLARLLPHLAYETLQGKGHMIPVTEPALCADFVTRMDAAKDA